MDNPTQQITGHHHITLNVGGAQEDYDFHTKTLGLKSVKKTLLYDGKAPIYHMYYGNDLGEPGTLVTCFPFRHAGLTASKGSGQVSSLALSVPDHALPYWQQRLQDQGIDNSAAEILGEKRVAFQHPCGIDYELVGTHNDDRTPATHDEVPSEMAIRGVHGITVSVRELELTDQFMHDGWGATKGVDDGSYTRYELGEGGSGTIIDVQVEPDRAAGSWHFGEGYIHHCAFNVENHDEQTGIKLYLEGMGYTDVSDVKDRGYFDSVYVRTPGGPLFEATVSKPKGFAEDEPVETMGAEIMIAPQFEDSRAELLAQLETIDY